MSDNVIEFGHDPTVESIISRLERFKNKIKHITVVVEWEDDSSGVYHNTKDIEKLCYENKILSKYVDDMFDDF